MARFCSKCGGKNEDDAKFCVECGNPFAQKTAPAPANTSAPTSGGARGFSKKLIAVPAAVIVLLGVAAAAWNYLDPNRATEANFLKGIEKYVKGDAAYVDKLVCNSDMPYGKNPMRIGFYDGRTREWMEKLKAAGVYGEPEQGQSGGYFSQPQLVYSLTEAGRKSVRGNKLCIAEGIKPSRIVRHEELRQAGDRKAAQVTFAYELTNVAPWAQSAEVRQGMTDNFKLDALEQNLLLATGKDGWEVTSPMSLGSASRPSTAREGGQPGFFARMMNSLSGLFSFGGPAATAESFYRAVEQGDLDKAQSYLSDQVYLMADRNKIRAAMAAQSEKMREMGGIKSINTQIEERDAYTRVKAHLVFSNGRETREKLKLVKENGTWKITPDK